MILYYDYGEDRTVPVYRQVLDKDGNIVDENGNILLRNISGSYYKQSSSGQYIKANDLFSVWVFVTNFILMLIFEKMCGIIKPNKDYFGGK